MRTARVSTLSHVQGRHGYPTTPDTPTACAYAMAIPPRRDLVPEIPTHPRKDTGQENRKDRLSDTQNGQTTWTHANYTPRYGTVMRETFLSIKNKTMRKLFVNNLLTVNNSRNKPVSTFQQYVITLSLYKCGNNDVCDELQTQWSQPWGWL